MCRDGVLDTETNKLSRWSQIFDLGKSSNSVFYMHSQLLFPFLLLLLLLAQTQETLDLFFWFLKN